MIKIYTDGSCIKNPDGPGGFGVIAINNNDIVYLYSTRTNNTTNNREELKAIINAFEYAQQDKNLEETFIIYSDSAYCVNMINDWIYKWQRNGWRRAKNQPIENLDLVQIIYKYITKDWFNCEVQKTSGHVGITENELADALATGDFNKFMKTFEHSNLKWDSLDKNSNLEWRD